MNQLRKGVLLSYFNIGLTNIIGLLLTPFIIYSLGNAEYGLYTLMGSLVAYLTLMDLGLNNTIIRFVAKYRAEGDAEGESRFLSTVAWLYAAIALLVIALGLFFYTKIEALFARSLLPGELEKAEVMYLILVVNMAVTIPGNAFLAICNACERFVFPRLLAAARYLSRAACIYVVLSRGGDAISLVIIDSVLNVSVVVISMVFVLVVLKIRIPFHRFDTGLAKEIFAYSFWVILSAIVFRFQWHGGQVVLGIHTDTVTVAVFGVGIMLGGYYGTFANAMNSILIPRATQMTVNQASAQKLTEMMIRVGRLNVFVLLLVLSGFFLFGKTFLVLWTGADYLPSWIVALLFMLVMTVPLVQVFGNSILEAKRKNRFRAVLYFTTIGVALSIGYQLSGHYGFYGVLIPLCVAMAINTIVMNIYYVRSFGFDAVRFFKEVFLKPLTLYGSMTFLGYALLRGVNIDSWMALLAGGLIYALCFGVLTWMVLMREGEKDYFRSVFIR